MANIKSLSTCPLDVQQMVKFVLDGKWVPAWNDPDNPGYKPQDNNNSLITRHTPYFLDSCKRNHFLYAT